MRMFQQVEICVLATQVALNGGGDIHSGALLLRCLLATLIIAELPARRGYIEKLSKPYVRSNFWYFARGV